MAIQISGEYNKLDLKRLTSEPAIALTDVLAFGDLSAANPDTRKVTVSELVAAILPSLTLSIFPTGVVAAYAGATAPSGFLMVSNLTIGSTSSGATARANADTEALFTLLWNSVTNTWLPIQNSAGTPVTRGATPAADFAANKRLPLLDARGRVIAGLDNMGGTSANRITLFDGDVIGITGGSESHVLTEAELPAHTHDVTAVPSITAAGAATGTDVAIPDAAAAITSTSVGSGDAHNNLQPTLVLPYIIKL